MKPIELRLILLALLVNSLSFSQTITFNYDASGNMKL